MSQITDAARPAMGTNETAMTRFVRYVVLAVIAVVLLLFAYANREVVEVSFDPFGSRENPAFAIAAPMFAVVIVFAALGVVAGAFATWLSQGRYRRASRQHRAEAQKWRAEAEAQKAARVSPAALPRD
jgi:uncharacterized integral membrane protein